MPSHYLGPAQRRRRARGARSSIILLTGFLLFALLRLTVRDREFYEVKALQNRMREMQVPSPRGTIYDRHGQVVARSEVRYQVLLMPAPADTLRERVQRLRPVLQLSDAQIESAFRRHARARHLPLELLRSAEDIEVARLRETLWNYPGTLIEPYAVRDYPAGPAIAHFIGYVSEITEAELARPRFRGYVAGQTIGKAGIERQYERHLGGKPGARYIEIDARGRILRWNVEAIETPPIPGRDLHLYLDLDLQRYIAHIFPKDMTGAIVAIDPKTGGVLAYYSHPTYDPNAFVGGIPTALWRQLNADPRRPLLDRVVASGQPAASTWKLAVAAMALDLDLVEPDEYMPVACTGGIYWGRYARCWYRPGHGRMNLIEGIKNSCNVYFYQLGIRIGLDRFLETGTRLGFGQRTGIDVPHEILPTFPENRDYWRRRFNLDPTDTEILSLAIGQGPITMTVIKLAQIYAALGMPDGRVPAPRLASDFGPPADTLHFQLDPREAWYLEAGMRRVVGPGGTAALSRLRDWDLVGKTGTAQNPHGRDHAWFVGTGARRGGTPEIAVTMFLEHAEHGYIASGYVAEAINFYLSRTHGVPLPEGIWATPRHRLRLNLPIDWNWSLPVQDPPHPDSSATRVASPDSAAAH